MGRRTGHRCFTYLNQRLPVRQTKNFANVADPAQTPLVSKACYIAENATGPSWAGPRTRSSFFAPARDRFLGRAAGQPRQPSHSVARGGGLAIGPGIGWITTYPHRTGRRARPNMPWATMRISTKGSRILPQSRKEGRRLRLGSSPGRDVNVESLVHKITGRGTINTGSSVVNAGIGTCA
jgi:hypothetical protein